MNIATLSFGKATGIHRLSRFSGASSLQFAKSLPAPAKFDLTPAISSLLLN
jgi:hypothetical protein